MASRLTLRRSTFGPRHRATQATVRADVRPLGAGLPPCLADALRDATTETELQEAAKAVVHSAMRCLEHRQFVEDLDVAWAQTKPCRCLGTEEIATLTTVIRRALELELVTLEGTSRPRGELLSLFDFIAELCWANYLSPSDQIIRRALKSLMTGDASDSHWKQDATSIGIEVISYFLTLTGPILSKNPLEVFTVLNPLMSTLARKYAEQPLRTQWFMSILFDRFNAGWRGTVHLEVSEEYWREEWALARLVILASLKEYPGQCPLAVLPSNAAELIAAGLCPRHPFNSAVAVWHDGCSDKPRKLALSHGITGESARGILSESADAIELMSRLTPVEMAPLRVALSGADDARSRSDSASGNDSSSDGSEEWLGD